VQEIRLLEAELAAAEEEAAAGGDAPLTTIPLSEDALSRSNDFVNSRGDPSEIVGTCGSDEISRANLQTLRPGSWLSDEVIHYWYTLMMKRDEKLCEKSGGKRR